MAEPQEPVVPVITTVTLAKKRKKKNYSSSHLAKMKTMRAREYRANETEEHRQARLAHMRLMAKHRRLSETKEEREHRLQMLRNNQKSRTKGRQRWLKEVGRLEQEMLKKSKNNSNIDESLKTAVNNLFDKRGFKSSSSLNKISRANNNSSANSKPKSRVKRKSKLLTKHTSCLLENNNQPNINNNDTKRIAETDSDDELLQGFDKFSVEHVHSRLISLNNILSSYMTDRKLAKNYSNEYENYLSKNGFHKTKDSDLNFCTNSNVNSSSVCRPPRKKIPKINRPEKPNSNVKGIKSRNKCSHDLSTDKIQNNTSTKPNIINLEEGSANIEVNVRLAVRVEKMSGKLLNKILSEQNSGFQNCIKDRNNALKPDESQCTINSVHNKRKRIRYNDISKTSLTNVPASSKTQSQRSLSTSNNLDLGFGCENTGKVNRYSSELEQSLKQKIRRQKSEFSKSNKHTSGKVLLLKNKTRNRWIVLEPVKKSEEIVLPTVKQPKICLKPLELLMEPLK